jgi:hypothetical protein
MKWHALAVCLIAVSTTAPAQEKAIRKEAVIAAPVAEVWKAWTTSEGIQGFFAPEAIVDPRPDGPFFIHFNPYAPAGEKGADDMRVLAVQPLTCACWPCSRSRCFRSRGMRRPTCPRRAGSAPW